MSGNRKWKTASIALTLCLVLMFCFIIYDALLQPAALKSAYIENAHKRALLVKDLDEKAVSDYTVVIRAFMWAYIYQDEEILNKTTTKPESWLDPHMTEYMYDWEPIEFKDVTDTFWEKPEADDPYPRERIISVRIKTGSWARFVQNIRMPNYPETINYTPWSFDSFTCNIVKPSENSPWLVESVQDY